MAQETLRPEYARLELLQEITTSNGSKAREIIFYRAKCSDMTALISDVRGGDRIEHFVASCCRAVNGGAEPLPFSSRELDASDAAEVSSVMNTMWREGESLEPTTKEGAPGHMTDGDGISSPIVYTLLHEIKLNPAEDAEAIKQIQFQARRVGEISEYLDSRGEPTKEFSAFMRTFGQLM